MLATQLNGMVTSGEINLNCIIQLNRYVCNTVQGDKKVIIILELMVLKSGADVGQRIGDPQPFDISKNIPAPITQPAEQAHQPSTSVQHNTQNVVASPSRITHPVKPAHQPSTSVQHSTQNVVASPARITQPVQPAHQPSTSVQRNSQKRSASPVRSQMGKNIHPIDSLTPYRNKWTIRARVTVKSDIRNWSNSRGEGRLFSVEFLDESGEIRATGFNQQLDKFYDILGVNKVYYVSGGTIKPANKQFNKLDHDFELTFNWMTEITNCEDDEALPTMQFSFIPISEIPNAENDAIVDVIGVCKEFGDIQMKIIRSSGRELEMRELQIVDDSNTEVTLTLWGKQAENFDGSQYPIIAFKRLKVSDFNGKTLSMIHSSSYQINPDINEAHRLKNWYENGGHQQDITMISIQRGSTGTGGVGLDFKTFAEAKHENLGAMDAPDYYSVKASVVFLRRENCIYTACPSDGCNKKVKDMMNGVFRCEKCNIDYNNFKWRFILSANLADATDNNWVTIFNDQVETLLGITANELGEMRESDSDKFEKVFSDANFKDYKMKLRVKMETFNDELRLKSTVVALEPIKPVTDNKRLISEIKQMAGLA
ncbi:unnamed protein product [Meganyctiphanes norvegica]|uniref:Replication protein A subunit n=1 Tax=Meganyctiphanes norvegica TaxID=48144 RepID=A0AAV2QQT5_MEGNR